MYLEGGGILEVAEKVLSLEETLTEEKRKKILMLAMLENLYRNKLIDINIYNKVKAEIEKS